MTFENSAILSNFSEDKLLLEFGLYCARLHHVLKGVCEGLSFLLMHFFVCYHNCIFIALRSLQNRMSSPLTGRNKFFFFHFHSHLLRTATPVNSELFTDTEMLKLLTFLFIKIWIEKIVKKIT